MSNTEGSSDLYMMPVLYVTDENQYSRTFKEMLFAIIIVLVVCGIMWFATTKERRVQHRPMDYIYNVRRGWPTL